MKINKLIAGITAIVAFSGNCLAQVPSWTSYGNVPGAAIRSVAIDDDGFVWTASFDAGVAKFDGTNMVTYNTTTTGGSLASNSTTAIAIDAADNKWIGTWSNGLYKFDGNNWTNYTSTSGALGFNRVNTITIDNNQNIWVGTSIGGMSVFNGSTWTIYKTTQGLPNNNVYDIHVQDNGTAWIGTHAGIARFTSGSFTTYSTSNSGLPMDQVYAIVEDSIGNLWIGTGGGLAKFDGTNWTVFNTSNSSLPFDYINSLSFDLDGNLFIGTTQGGLAKFDGTNWEVFNTSNSNIPDNDVKSLAVDQNNMLWVGTNVGGLASYGIEIVPNLKPIAVDDSYTISEDQNGAMFSPLSNDSDPESQTLTLSIISVPSHGSVMNMSGSLHYEVDDNYYGTDTIVYQACDVPGLCDTATVLINITPVNDAPVVTGPFSFLTAADEILNACLSYSDIEGDNVTVTVQSIMSSGDIVFTNECFQFTPDTSFSGTESITLEICDDAATPACSTINVDMNVSVITSLSNKDLNELSIIQTGHSILISSPDNCTVEIYDITGRRLVNQVQTRGPSTLGLEKFNIGIYVIKVTSGNCITSKKISLN